MRRDHTIVLAVILSTFFVGFGGGVVFPILPNLGSILGISPFLVGIILSANRFTRTVANTPAGALVDRIGTRRPFITGLFVEAVATLGYIAAMLSASPEAWFLLARVIWGIGSALVFATAYTIAADVSTGASRGTNMGVVRGGMTLGFPAGLVLGGVVSELFSIPTAFALAAAFALVAGVLASATIPETHVSGAKTAIKPWEIETTVPALTVGLVNFGLYFAYLGALFSTLVLFLAANDFSVFEYGPQATSGVLMAITVLSASVLMLGGGVVSDRLGRRVPVLLAFLAVSFVGFLLLTVAGSVGGLLLACVFIGAGQGGTSGPLIALLADLTPEDRTGRAMGTNNVLGDIGGGLGPVLSLPLVESVGFSPVYAACAVIPLLAGAILVYGVYRQTGSVSPRTTVSE
ncbi:MFS transporter [Halalkalicoccus jeotgali]|uniref:Major facilitator superfamily MFS_1 n=1 Tax=Halalkalicoccus jeotgali (strain DSM 18796 / CECT 7217 / JCM 14584 / KCTC 4019 / B3) TaxID=795797 RepID=D8JAN0_HALJB|nr:MFS transporter [Halalkalicoccus jeotgali]ADJ14752.1 major facilitator superfamily MFS_1 [Halalkalicoccus jeotgali B3]ELY39334.1 major facilitator superfamily protein [Halalkalicoccus jeotgali B3]